MVTVVLAAGAKDRLTEKVPVPPSATVRAAGSTMMPGMSSSVTVTATVWSARPADETVTVAVSLAVLVSGTPVTTTA